MLFNSPEFLLLFLPVVLIVYFASSHRVQNVFLVVASCVFYASWDWRFLLPLLATTSLDFRIAKAIEASAARGEPRRRRKALLIASLVANLGLLGYFKYFNFFADTLRVLLGGIGIDIAPRTFDIVLPIAISFYTFQAMSYTIDVYRGEFHATRSFWDFFLAVLYFPHLIAGPIQRAATLLPQVIQPRVLTRARAMEGLHLVIWGFFKKVAIADNLAPIADAVFQMQPAALDGGTVAIGVLAFCFQIYCDFSGYTDIARGIAKIMGFEFVLNFNLPYFARSPSDFWRRWHISLSTWLRDYLYKPLGGNRDGFARTCRNLMITMLLGGLWHGAAWNFILWGAYHGALLVGERVWERSGFALVPRTRLASAAHGLLCTAGMFLLTCYGWLLFRASSMEQIVAMTTALQAPFSGGNAADVIRICVLVGPLLAVQAAQRIRGDLYFLNPAFTPLVVRVVAYSVMVYMCLFHGGPSQAFVYFQF